MIKFNHNNKVYNFFHIPKTAGTSISNVIKNNFEYEFIWKKYKQDYSIGFQHLSYKTFEKHVDSDDINFAVIRHPVDRIVSLYKNFIVKDKYQSFTDWYESITVSAPHILKSQKEILEGGKFILYKFDNLKPLEKELNVTLPMLNVIEDITKIDQHEVDLILSRYSEDFEVLERINHVQQFYEL
jgi:hypothetical protein